MSFTALQRLMPSTEIWIPRQNRTQYGEHGSETNKQNHWSAGSSWAAFKAVEIEQFFLRGLVCVFGQRPPPKKTTMNEFDPDMTFGASALARTVNLPKMRATVHEACCKQC